MYFALDRVYNSSRMAPSTDPTHWYDVVGALGAAVGATAAAAGAAAAWRAAVASRATSRDALDALAYAIAPRLDVNFGLSVPPHKPGEAAGPRRWKARLTNPSNFAATAITFEARFRDGRPPILVSTERLAPTRETEVWTAREHHDVNLGEHRPGGSANHEALLESAVMRFTDERGIARYEQTVDFLWTVSKKGTITSTMSQTTVNEPIRIK